MSKYRFIFMSLLPNVVFGLIPYIMFLVHHEWLLCGLIGAFCISMGFGDYINVFNAITQMPGDAKRFCMDFIPIGTRNRTGHVNSMQVSGNEMI